MKSKATPRGVAFLISSPGLSALAHLTSIIFRVCTPSGDLSWTK